MTFVQRDGKSNTETLVVPISKQNPLHDGTSSIDLSTPRVDHPAIGFDNDRFIRPSRSPTTILQLDLRTTRLNAVHKYLWLAGLQRAARPLHRQQLLGRRILITEDPNEHLVWFENCIYIKPLPDYLFNHAYWDAHLCSDEDLYRSACGMLLSYSWLIRHKSDLNLARECRLIPTQIDWDDWVSFLEGFFDNIDPSTSLHIDERYLYGELRLSRLHAIYKLLPPNFSLRNFIRGYRTGPSWHSAFFERNFKWMLVIFAILSVFLSALQVALAAPTLEANESFYKAAAGFAIASLIAITASVALVFVVWITLVCYNLLSTWRYDKKARHKRRRSASTG